jgi:hypothetical protein
MKRTAIIIFTIISIAGTVVVYFSYNPVKVNLFPPCLFHELTGLQCPGCGSQRAIHSLLHLEIKQAFFYNPALCFAIPLVVLLIYLEYFGGRTRFPKLHQLFSGTKFITEVLIVIILYWIGRNLINID